MGGHLGLGGLGGVGGIGGEGFTGSKRELLLLNSLIWALTNKPRAVQDQPW